jgi:hypothetical protein
MQSKLGLGCRASGFYWVGIGEGNKKDSFIPVSKRRFQIVKLEATQLFRSSLPSCHKPKCSLSLAHPFIWTLESLGLHSQDKIPKASQLLFWALQRAFISQLV